MLVAEQNAKKARRHTRKNLGFFMVIKRYLDILAR